MAVVIAKHWIPKLENVSALLNLRAPVCVYGYVGDNEHPSAVDLLDSGGSTAVLRGQYDDVRFKFECLHVAVDLSVTQSPYEPVLKATVAGWNSVRCLVGCDWERPARDAELPAQYVQIVGETGQRRDVPDDVLAIGVFVKGFALWNDRSNQPMAAIIASNDVPGTLEIVTDSDQLRFTVANSEVVGLRALDAWTQELNAWLEALQSPAA